MINANKNKPRYASQEQAIKPNWMAEGWKLWQAAPRVLIRFQFTIAPDSTETQQRSCREVISRSSKKSFSLCGSFAFPVPSRIFPPPRLPFSLVPLLSLAYPASRALSFSNPTHCPLPPLPELSISYKKAEFYILVEKGLARGRRGYIDAQREPKHIFSLMLFIDASNQIAQARKARGEP